MCVSSGNQRPTGVPVTVGVHKGGGLASLRMTVGGAMKLPGRMARPRSDGQHRLAYAGRVKPTRVEHLCATSVVLGAAILALGLGLSTPTLPDGVFTIALTLVGLLGIVMLGWFGTGRILASAFHHRTETMADEVLADAGHELRTPLTVIRGHLELLDPDDSDDVARTRGLVLGEVDRAERLVDDLVTLTTANKPGFLRLSIVDVAELVDRVSATARAMGRRDWRIDAQAHAYVVADPERLTQVLLQLAHNAVRHTRDGDVVAFGSGYDERSNEVHMWVRDTGPGVPPEDAQRIFRRYERGTAAGLQDRRAGRRGQGLGLAIVRAIARAHGGRVDVEPAPVESQRPPGSSGPGAKFTLTLAAVGKDERASGAPSASQQATTGTPR